MPDQVNIPIAILTPRGLEPSLWRADSLAEAAKLEPQGVYTLARTFHRDRVLLLDEHFDRLERSARLEGVPVRIDRPALRSALRSLVDATDYADSRFRITVPLDEPETLVISLERFKSVAPDLISGGVRTITINLERRHPEAKTTAWMSARQPAVDGFPSGIYEGILVSPAGFLLEGTSSNFYVVLGGRLRTADESMVLSGMARRIVLTVAPTIAPPLLTAVHRGKIPEFEEAFLTSAGRGVVPIVEIDGQRLGTGMPGTITGRLRAAYDAWAEAHLEPI